MVSYDKELKRKIPRLKHGVSGRLSRCTYERDDLVVLRDITVTGTQPCFHCTRDACSTIAIVYHRTKHDMDRCTDKYLITRSRRRF